MAIVAPPMTTRPNRFALAACTILASASAALAQSTDEVTVYPNAAGRVLLYPGGKFGRVQRPLLQPGEADPNAPIVLHMPRRHPHHRVALTKPKAPSTAVATAASPPPKSKKPEVTAEQPTVPITALPDESAARLVATMPQKPAAKPVPQKPAASAQQAPAQAAPTRQLAQSAVPKPQAPRPAAVPSDNGAPSDTAPAGQAERSARVEPLSDLSKRNSILFAPGAEEPPPSALDSVRAMTASLTAALWSGSAHVELNAFGGKANDKSSEARRLSLKRALIIRQLLIDDGIPSERIVVHAMGGASDGAPDRVDIYVAA